MHVEVVSSEEQIFASEVEFIIAPGTEGELGIFPHHIPLLNKLRPGVLRIKLPTQDEQVVYAISGGFLEVQGNRATVLADIVERTDALDEAKLLEQKRLAEERLKASGASLNSEDAKAYANLELIIAQIRALEYVNKHARRG
jgi:F-type H+-transporting ATPase subunit epsilon